MDQRYNSSKDLSTKKLQRQLALDEEGESLKPKIQIEFDTSASSSPDSNEVKRLLRRHILNRKRTASGAGQPYRTRTQMSAAAAAYWAEPATSFASPVSYGSVDSQNSVEWESASLPGANASSVVRRQKWLQGRQNQPTGLTFPLYENQAGRCLHREMAMITRSLESPSDPQVHLSPSSRSSKESSFDERAQPTMAFANIVSPSTANLSIPEPDSVQKFFLLELLKTGVGLPHLNMRPFSPSLNGDASSQDLHDSPEPSLTEQDLESLQSLVTEYSEQAHVDLGETAFTRLLRFLVRQPVQHLTEADDLPRLCQLNTASLSKACTSTGLAFDAGMLLHGCQCTDRNNPAVHPECPRRLLSVLQRLTDEKFAYPRMLFDLYEREYAPLTDCAGSEMKTVELRDPFRFLIHSILRDEKMTAHSLIELCQIVRAPLAKEAELLIFHTRQHLLRLQNKLDKGALLDAVHCKLACGGIGLDYDTTWHEHFTERAARSAVGQLLHLTRLIRLGRLRNGFALIRPPGHHAEPNQAMGFCYLNSVALTALNVLREKLASRILILDWDIHHGNGTRQALDYCPTGQLLYISLHRYDAGGFFPGTGQASPEHRYTVNVPWGRHSEEDADLANSNGSSSQSLLGLSDAEYLAAMRCVVLPVARQFEPDLVLVSAGFDACVGHCDNIGGYSVSPGMFVWMTRQLMCLASGAVVLALEGGYSSGSLDDCVAGCLSALLLPDPIISKPDEHDWNSAVSFISPDELQRVPCTAAQLTLKQVLAVYGPDWPCLRTVSELDVGSSHVSALERRCRHSRLTDYVPLAESLAQLSVDRR